MRYERLRTSSQAASSGAPCPGLADAAAAAVALATGSDCDILCRVAVVEEEMGRELGNFGSWVQCSVEQCGVEWGVVVCRKMGRDGGSRWRGGERGRWWRRGRVGRR